MASPLPLPLGESALCRPVPARYARRADDDLPLVVGRMPVQCARLRLSGTNWVKGPVGR